MTATATSDAESPRFERLVAATVIFLAVTLIALEVHERRQGAPAGDVPAEAVAPESCEECGQEAHLEESQKSV